MIAQNKLAQLRLQSQHTPGGFSTHLASTPRCLCESLTRRKPFYSDIIFSWTCARRHVCVCMRVCVRACVQSGREDGGRRGASMQSLSSADGYDGTPEGYSPRLE